MRTDIPPGFEPTVHPNIVPSLSDHAASVTAQRLTRLLSYAEDVRRGDSVEAVHDMRVWSRQTRAALEAFSCCFHGAAYRAIERDVKAVADVLGEARDLDVMIDMLGKRSQDLPEGQRAGLDGFIADLRQRRAATQRRVEKAVTILERRDLVRRLTALASAPTRRQKGNRKGKRHG